MLNELYGRGGMALQEFIQNYRRKLGAFEREPWEPSQEISLQRKKSLADIPKRPTKLKLELIDVDLVRGSTFSKKKPQLSWTFFSRESILRVLFLPWHAAWWRKQTSPSLFLIALHLYFFQILSLVIYGSHILNEQTDLVSGCDTLSAIVLVFVIAEILTQAERHDAPVLNDAPDDLSIALDDLTSMSDQSVYVGEQRASRSGKPRRRVFSKKKSIGTHRRTSDLVFSPPFERDAECIKETEGRTCPGSDSETSEQQSSRLLKPSPSDGFDLGEKEEEETTDSGVVGATDEDSVRRPSVSHADGDQSDCSAADYVTDKWINHLPTLARSEPARTPDMSDKDTTDESARSSSASSCSSPFDCMLTGSDDDGSEEPTLFSERFRKQQTPSQDQVIGCTMWEGRSVHKADLSVYEITNYVVKQAESAPVTVHPLILVVLPIVFALLPAAHGIFRELYMVKRHDLRTVFGGWEGNLTMRDVGVIVVKVNGIVQRYFWGFWFFLLLAVALETFHQRLWVAKYFGYLTSVRRARRVGLPHFRLSKVRNVKTWLCVRSCLKKYGPRKSVDVAVSFSFLSCLVCVIFTCGMLVNAEEHFTSSIYVWESMLWLLAVGLFLLRFMVLGSKTNQKFRNSTVLTTEQLNLYLRMEQKPHKKDELMLVNNVLKLAADLIKEIENPCRISGLPANPVLYNVSRLLILSAFSTLISEMCGIKISLYKLNKM